MSRNDVFDELIKEAKSDSAYIIASINDNNFLRAYQDENQEGHSMIHELGRELARDMLINKNEQGHLFFSGAIQGMIDVVGYECAEKAFKKICSDYESMVKGEEI